MKLLPETTLKLIKDYVKSREKQKEAEKCARETKKIAEGFYIQLRKLFGKEISLQCGKFQLQLKSGTPVEPTITLTNGTTINFSDVTEVHYKSGKDKLVVKRNQIEKIYGGRGGGESIDVTEITN